MENTRHLVDPAAEMSLLAGILATPALFDDVVTSLGDDDFGNPACAALWRAIQACDASGRGIDRITVTDELRRTKQLKVVGGEEGIGRLLASAPDVVNVEAWTTLLREKAQLRRLLVAGLAITAAVKDPSVEAPDALEAAERALLDLSGKQKVKGCVSSGEAVAAVMREIEAAGKQKMMGTSTGLRDLDKLTGGLRGGQLVVLAARPGIGKSALALTIAQRVAEETGEEARVYSYEMNHVEMMMRMLASTSQTPLGLIQSGRLPAHMDQAFASAAEHLSALPVVLVDQPPTTITGLRSELRRAARRTKIGCVVVDYIQLMGGEGKFKDSNRQQEVSEVTRGLKLIAMELNVPVIALSQLNRKLEERPNKRPLLSDLRDSGSVEQDADTVWFLYRDCQYNPSSPLDHAELDVAKQRSGPQGRIEVLFDGPCVRFANWDGPTSGGQGGPPAPLSQSMGGRSGQARPF